MINILIHFFVYIKTEYNLIDCLIKEDNYEYSNATWKDQLTNYNNMTITYDNIGNPITIGNSTLTWKNGKELASDRVTWLNVNYNVDGIRIGKTVNNVRTDYLLENNLIIIEKTGNNVLYYIRDNKGDAVGFVYNNIKYYYKKNYHNDVIGTYDSSYNLIVNYDYDPDMHMTLMN